MRRNAMFKNVMAAIPMLALAGIGRPAAADEVGRCYPKISDFQGADLQILTAPWALQRGSNSPGSNDATNIEVPAGRVVVDWRAEERSCIRCEGPHLKFVLFDESGPIRIPQGVRVGVRFKKGWIGGPGASYTGSVTIIHVARDKWSAVFSNKYLTCAQGGAHRQ
jgi:hypothetical protein